MSELGSPRPVGVVVGIGTGAVTNVLGATIALRWFRTHRGLVVGAFAAASSAGQLVFVSLLAWIVLSDGWRSAIGTPPSRSGSRRPGRSAHARSTDRCRPATVR
jgi:hypothetical protein